MKPWRDYDLHVFAVADHLPNALTLRDFRKRNRLRARGRALSAMDGSLVEQLGQIPLTQAEAMHSARAKKDVAFVTPSGVVDKCAPGATTFFHVRPVVVSEVIMVVKSILPGIAGICLFASMSLGAASAQNAGELRVYRADGSLQCGMGAARTLAEDREKEGLGATVLSSEKRVLPIMISQVCGAPTGRVNTYLLAETEWVKIKEGFVGPAKFARWIYDQPTLEVYKYDGDLQCNLGKGITIDQMRDELESAGVEVVRSRKDTDGLYHVAVCGKSTGSINVYEITNEHFHRAAHLGFAYFYTRTSMMQTLGRSSESEVDTSQPQAGASDPDDPLPWPLGW